MHKKSVPWNTYKNVTAKFVSFLLLSFSYKHSTPHLLATVLDGSLVFTLVSVTCTIVSKDLLKTTSKQIFADANV